MADPMVNNISWGPKDKPQAKEIYKGIWRTILWQAESGPRAQIVEFEPGTRFEDLDIHEPGPEEILVLEGVFNDGIRDYPEGIFIHNPKGSSHIPQSKTGCKIFVYFPEG